MPFCPNCGNNVDNGAKFCPSCGAPQAPQNTTSAAPEINYYDAQPSGSSGQLNTVQLVWSIINLVMCCTPMGIAGIILTILAKDAHSAEEEAKKLKIAKICNIVGTVGFVVLMIVYVALMVIGMSIGMNGVEF